MMISRKSDIISLRHICGKSTNKGAFGRAVRPLEEHEFDAILRAGYAAELDPARTAEPLAELEPLLVPGLAEADASFERPLVERVLSRPVRDPAFSRAVQAAYGATCALTGIKIVNGGGRAEVQAAHIRPVKDAGPDSVRNGIALSCTVHWMFDRGLISLGDPPEYPILLTRRGLPDNVQRLFNPDGRLRRPSDPRLWPAPSYLEFHRREVFRG